MKLADAVRELAYPLRGPEDLDPLLERIGDARCVLLGEALHGTLEYYTWRTIISERLIREKGFSFIAVKGDWPDCYEVNRYVKGYPDSGKSAREVLEAFDRWPTWMWATEEILELAERLRQHNGGLPEEEKVGFYGLDVYSLWDSMEAVIEYLERVDPEAVDTARRAYKCFEPYGEDVRECARATALVPTSCEDEVVEMLADLRNRLPEYRDDPESRFSAEQNALVVRGAERYYRVMVRGGSYSWNVRDRHMVETLERLMRPPRAGRQGARLGAQHPHRRRALHRHGERRHGERRAARARAAGGRGCGAGRFRFAPGQRHCWRRVGRPHGAHAGSSSQGGELGGCPPPCRRGGQAAGLRGGRGRASRGASHRAIGVVYDPARERYGNYVPTVLPRRHDAFLYLDETRALHPISMQPQDDGEPPETFPSGE